MYVYIYMVISGPIVDAQIKSLKEFSPHSCSRAGRVYGSIEYRFTLVSESNVGVADFIACQSNNRQQCGAAL